MIIRGTLMGMRMETISRRPIVQIGLIMSGLMGLGYLVDRLFAS